MMNHGTGLRERKKQATRQALHESALRLVAGRGLERVTIEAIADGARVSRRTFSNYFANKEAALLYGHDVLLRRLLRLVRARPLAESAWTCLFAATDDLLAGCEGDDPLCGPGLRIAVDDPALVHQIAVTYAAAEHDLAIELARRLGDDPDPATRLRVTVLAATFLTSLRVAARVWMEQPQRPPTDLLRQVLGFWHET